VTAVWSSYLKLETSYCERFQSGKVFGVATCGFGSEISSRQRVASGGSGVADALGWILGVVDLLEEALGRLGMCHDHDAGQILTTTMFDDDTC